MEETGDNDDGGVDGDDDDDDDDADADAPDDDGNDGECVSAAQDDLEEEDSVGDRLRSTAYARVPVEILPESCFAVEPLLNKYCKEQIEGQRETAYNKKEFPRNLRNARSKQAKTVRTCGFVAMQLASPIVVELVSAAFVMVEVVAVVLVMVTGGISLDPSLRRSISSSSLYVVIGL